MEFDGLDGIVPVLPLALVAWSLRPLVDDATSLYIVRELLSMPASIDELSYWICCDGTIVCE